MNQIQNTYRRPVPLGWRGRWMHRFGMDVVSAPLMKGAMTIPNWLTGKSLVFFFVSMLVCFAAFGYPMEVRDAVIAGLSVVLFFYGSMSMSKSWERKKDRTFVRNVFVAGLIVRLIWAFYCYFILNPADWGTTYGDGADVEWYMPFGEAIAEWIRGNNHVSFHELTTVQWKGAIDDWGYPIWLALVNILTGGESDVFIPFIVKSIVSAYCSVCVFHVAKRHYGDGVARMAAIFVAFNPNMIYWCGNMFKESEMVFLCCLSVDQFDKVLNSGQRFSLGGMLPGVLAASALFFFRASLAVVIFLAVLVHIVTASNRVMSMGKKIFAGVIVFVTLLVGLGDNLRSQTENMVQAVQTDQQRVNMEWRSRRAGGNAFAKYASKAVFAPLIFTIPFPSFNVALESQVLQRQLSGGSYIKNIISFFVIIVMFMMLISGEWRRHVFIIAYTVGYHAVLALSAFAQSGRFHMPVIPMMMLFAAYGIQVAKTNGKVKRWFTIALMIEVVACLAWNWFKLKGRGMV